MRIKRPATPIADHAAPTATDALMGFDGDAHWSLACHCHALVWGFTDLQRTPGGRWTCPLPEAWRNHHGNVFQVARGRSVAEYRDGFGQHLYVLPSPAAAESFAEGRRRAKAGLRTEHWRYVVL